MLICPQKKIPVQAMTRSLIGLVKGFVIRRYSGLQVEDEMLQCSVCEDWFHSRVSVSINWSQIFPPFLCH